MEYLLYILILACILFEVGAMKKDGNVSKREHRLLIEQLSLPPGGNRVSSCDDLAERCKEAIAADRKNRHAGCEMSRGEVSRGSREVPGGSGEVNSEQTNEHTNEDNRD
jgi:hypothetical protein